MLFSKVDMLGGSGVQQYGTAGQFSTVGLVKMPHTNGVGLNPVEIGERQGRFAGIVAPTFHAVVKQNKINIAAPF